MATSEIQLDLLPLEDESLYSAQECLANQQVWPGSEKAKMITVGSGRQLSISLNQSNLLGAFSKILLESLAWTSSEEFCYVWERLDTRYGCSAYQLTPLGQSTGDSESSLFATPQAHDAAQGDPARVGRYGTKHGGRNLTDEVMVPKLWRTPQASDGMGGPSADPDQRKLNGNSMNLRDQSRHQKLWPTPRNEGFDAGCHKGKPDSLHAAAKLWPTPNAADGTGGGSPIRSDPNVTGGRSNLRDAVNPSPSQGSLNVQFVEELMGYPIDHTALKHLGTPSFRNKLTRSSKLSTKP